MNIDQRVFQAGKFFPTKYIAQCAATALLFYTGCAHIESDSSSDYERPSLTRRILGKITWEEAIREPGDSIQTVCDLVRRNVPYKNAVAYWDSGKNTWKNGGDCDGYAVAVMDMILEKGMAKTNDIWILIMNYSQSENTPPDNYSINNVPDSHAVAMGQVTENGVHKLWMADYGNFYWVDDIEEVKHIVSWPDLDPKRWWTAKVYKPTVDEWIKKDRDLKIFEEAFSRLTKI